MKGCRSMKDSAIVRFAVFVARSLACIYNGSFLEKLISSVCLFFKKRSGASFFVGLFTRESEHKIRKNSFFFRAVSFPVRLAASGAEKHEAFWRRLVKKSALSDILDNLIYIPLRQYGALLSAFSAGMIASLLLFGHLSKINLIIFAFFAVLSVVLLLIPASAAALYSSGKILRIFGDIFVCGRGKAKETPYRAYRIDVMIPLAVFFALLGAVSGALSPLVFAFSVVSALAVVLILHNTLIGVFVLVCASPVMPTMVCAALAALTLLSFAVGLLTGRQKLYSATPLALPVSAFLALALFASAASFSAESSIKVFLLYFVFASSYFVIVNCVRTRAQWHALVVTFICTGFLVGLYGVLQNFIGAVTDSSWVDTEMFSDIGTRVYSTFDNPNVLGQYLVLVIPVSFAAMCSAESLIKRFIFFAMTAIMSACLLFTWSRAAWVAIILAIGFFLVIKDRRWASLCVLVLIVLPFVLPESILLRLLSIGNLKDSSTAYRVSVWVASARMAKDYIISGIGLGSGAFERVYQQYALNGAGFAIHSHNFYIQLVVEMGIFGLVSFVSIIYTAFRRITAARLGDRTLRNFAFAVGGALIGYLFQGMAENLWYNYHMVLIFWIYLALLESGVSLSEGVKHDLAELPGGDKW